MFHASVGRSLLVDGVGGRGDAIPHVEKHSPNAATLELKDRQTGRENKKRKEESGDWGGSRKAKCLPLPAPVTTARLPSNRKSRAVVPECCDIGGNIVSTKPKRALDVVFGKD